MDGAVLGARGRVGPRIPHDPRPMSFQGDVRGIGLAELLQGLARGRKEGILTLTSRGGRRCVVGLDEGRAHLLPDPDEDAERWRNRARNAYADSPRADSLRMSQIARAHRLEELYELLDGGDVHFRFEPGVVPRQGPSSGEEGEQRTQVFCEATQVEFLLLEYARVADELEGQPGARELSPDLVPCVLDPSPAGGTPLPFLEQCDGRSTLQEVADRLGWPIRQARLTVAPALARGGLRAAHPIELLQLAMHELKSKHFARAAVRLGAWCRDGAPGPLDENTAESLESEWLGGRLSAALRVMSPRARRTLLRRLDHGLRNDSQAVVHWLEATRLDRTDRIAQLKRMAAEFREGSDPDTPTVRDLLDWGRDQREKGHPWRAAPVLVMAAQKQPTNTSLQLELGTGLVAAGRAAEGAPWVLSGSRELLEQGHADRAVTPLRSLLAEDPRNRECRQLLSRARRQSTQVRKLRKNLMISLAMTGVIAGAALVKVKVDADRGARLDEVRQRLGDPWAAYRLLQDRFGEDYSVEVRELRDQIEERRRLEEMEQRSAWLAKYQDAQLEATKGDPLAALGKIRAVPPPPKLQLVREPWPDPKDLLDSLVEHLADELQALGEPVEGSPQQVAREDQIHGWAETLIVTATAEEPVAPYMARFARGLEEVQELVEARRAERDARIEARLAMENLDRQDALYRKGEAYASSGDLVRALNCWEECIEIDRSGKVERLLEERVAEVRGQLAAIQRARGLAGEGRHEQAIELLRAKLDDPTDVILPWKVDSYPHEVTATQSAHRVWRTPFTIESTLGEEVQLTFTAEGYETRTVTFDRPADRTVHLERSPDRAWRGEGRVDAIPVAVEDDHLVADRKGNLARVQADGGTLWRTRIKTLSGIARAPVFLPHRPGDLLLVTEDGDAWIVASEDGDLQGPWQLGSAPVIGPSPSGGHVRVRLSDGRQVLWRDALQPVIDEAAGPLRDEDASTRFGADGGFAVARRREGHRGDFPCPWTSWIVRVEEKAFMVHPESEPESGYSILRRGEWEFVAWESPTAHAPHGRLWASDGRGVRAYVPVEDVQR